MGRRNGIMWVYEKRLQFPVNIKRPDPKAAQIIISQYGGLFFRKV
jgi:spore coat protein JC